MMNATRFNTKKCGCGIVTSVLVSAVDFRAMQMHNAWPAGNPLPAAGVRLARNGNLAVEVSCRGCGTLRYALPVRGKLSVKHACGSKCLESTGFLCECSCGGKNHGAGHADVEAAS